jgi:dissimilatory sulfite reductase (desulfoviridin) alpha/beta subunit
MTTSSLSKTEIAAVKAQGFLQNRGTESFSGRILTINGRLTAEQVIGLAEAARKFGSGQVSFTTRLNLEIPGIPYEKIPAFRESLAAYGLTTGGTGPKVRPVLSCKGGVCQNGLFDTFALAEEIFERFVVGYRDLVLPNKFKIGIGGCPNNCAKPDLSDLGITGQMKPSTNKETCRQCRVCQKSCPAEAVTLAQDEDPPVIDEAKCLKCGLCVRLCKAEAMTGRFSYKVYLGGRWGRLTRAGQPLSRDFAAKDDVMKVLETAIRFFADQGLKGERISGTVERLGFLNVEKALLGTA